MKVNFTSKSILIFSNICSTYIIIMTRLKIMEYKYGQTYAKATLELPGLFSSHSDIALSKYARMFNSLIADQPESSFYDCSSPVDMHGPDRLVNIDQS